MKTLNEVIKALENVALADTDGESEGYFLAVDSLHYMKEYKRVQNKIEKIALGNIEDTLDKIDNPALTWDELKAMEGKPVWVEALLYKQWAVIAYIGEEYIRFEGANLYAPECRIYMGEDNGWQAYRKERS